MTQTVLLDTHIALWLDSGNQRLKPSTRNLIDSCWQGGGSILISAVTVWEIALLVDCGRIHLDQPVDVWLDRFTSLPGVETVPLDPIAAARAYHLQGLEHRDPGDRLLIATAIQMSCPLITYDDRIGRFAERYGTEYGFTAQF